jgi:hypothetical protein
MNPPVQAWVPVYDLLDASPAADPATLAAAIGAALIAELGDRGVALVQVIASWPSDQTIIDSLNQVLSDNGAI